MSVRALTEGCSTVTEAAALLGVSPSTIRRWIRGGALPASRIGQRRVALRRADLAAVITPTKGNDEGNAWVVSDRPIGRRLGPEEQRRGLEALDRAARRARRTRARRGGKPFCPLMEVLDDLRDERTRQQATESLT